MGNKFGRRRFIVRSDYEAQQHTIRDFLESIDLGRGGRVGRACALRVCLASAERVGSDLVQLRGACILYEGAGGARSDFLPVWIGGAERRVFACALSIEPDRAVSADADGAFPSDGAATTMGRTARLSRGADGIESLRLLRAARFLGAFQRIRGFVAMCRMERLSGAEQSIPRALEKDGKLDRAAERDGSRSGSEHVGRTLRRGDGAIRGTDLGYPRAE